MEQINEKYFLGSNKTTLILYEKKISETTGKENYKKIGYYATLDGVYNALMEKEIRDDLGLIKNIEKVNKLIKELKQFTADYIEKNVG